MGGPLPPKLPSNLLPEYNSYTSYDQGQMEKESKLKSFFQCNLNVLSESWLPNYEQYLKNPSFFY